MLLDTNAIQKILPHRYPFLLVDAIEEMERWKRIVGIKNVSINESYFQGHFPGMPIMPGVLIIESMAQTAGVLLLQEVKDREKKLIYFVSIDNARFRRPVVPGDQLKIEMNVVAWRHGFWEIRWSRNRERRSGGRSDADVQNGRSRDGTGACRRTRRKSSMSEIDPRAVVSPSAKLGNCVQVGAFAIVGDEVELGDGCVVEPHAVVSGPSTFGRNNHFYSFSIVGGDPQDLTYTGQRVRLEVGDANEFREFCTVHRGTIKGGGVTRVGSHNLIMAYAHIGHDCQIGNHVILTNGAQLAGHSVVEDYAGISAFCLFHQFVRIGGHSYIGAGTIITQDVPPFSLIVGARARRAATASTRSASSATDFRPSAFGVSRKPTGIFCARSSNTSQAVEKMRGTLSDSEDVQSLIRFIESTTDARLDEIGATNGRRRRKHAARLGTHRRKRRFPFSRARRRAQPRHRHGRDRDSRGGFAGARARGESIPLDQPRRTRAAESNCSIRRA